jgi:hypothetical protein
MTDDGKPYEASGGVTKICDFIVSNAADRTLAIGPLVWQPSDGTSNKVHYFIVGSADTEKQFHCERIICESEADRFAIYVELINHKPLVVHDFDDELEMAKWCEAIWPCDKSHRIRKALEQERKGRHPSKSEE